MAAWWRQTFPKASIRFVNAGIGATGSDYGALRVKRDLLAHHPDFVVVEYAVNDPNTQAAAETLEGLVRQILREANQPAVLLLFTMNQDGGNAQEWQGKVGRHYDLPMVSFRDALWPEIKEGRMKWNDAEFGRSCIQMTAAMITAPVSSQTCSIRCSRTCLPMTVCRKSRPSRAASQ